jgi:hypothetical protein
MKHNIVNRMALFTALAGIILALAGLAHAGTVGTQRSQKPQKAKKGTVNITVATDVGGITLEPGEYEVKQVNSATGPVVRFTRFTFNAPYPIWSESYEGGRPEYDWETVAEVKVTMQPLASTAIRTKLLLASNGDKALGLEIRGNSFDYLF